MATAILLSGLGNAVHAEQISIAVASNFTAPMRELARVFEERTGNEVRLSSGSSGKIFAQIQNGAPFQAFFSADQDKPAQLEQQGRIVPGSRFTYAQGRLVLWSAREGTVDDAGEVLKQGKFKRLAIANPRLAPYGIAAMELLANLSLTDKVSGKLVQGENISQTYQFVATGNTDLGLVALSQILHNGRMTQGSMWRVPENLYQPILQDAVILSGQSTPALEEFWRFAQSQAAQVVIRSFGYETSATPP